MRMLKNILIVIVIAVCALYVYQKQQTEVPVPASAFRKVDESALQDLKDKPVSYTHLRAHETD